MKEHASEVRATASGIRCADARKELQDRWIFPDHIRNLPLVSRHLFERNALFGFSLN